jgi:tetratricopeptide (TPR) repeat protein
MAIEEVVTLRRQLAAAYPAVHNPALAQSLNNLALRLAALGRYEEALTAITDTVTLRRQLAAAYPDAYTRDLATSLRNKGFVLSRLGRRRDALGVDGQAVTLFRTLYARHPDRYRQALAAAPQLRYRPAQPAARRQRQPSQWRPRGWCATGS